MNETIPNQATESVRGWVLYDGDCSFCVNVIARLEPLLRRQHFDLAPLQTPWVQQRLGLNSDELLTEMKLLAANGRIYGGADAWLQIAGRIWWAWPLFALAHIPGVKLLIHAVYRRIAANRHWLNGICRLRKS